MRRAQGAPALTTLARAAGVTPSRLRRAFKARVGLTPKAYDGALRAARLRDWLPRSRSITRSIRSAGFGSATRFYAQATALLGMKAGEYRAGAPGMRIMLATGRSSLGVVLVAATTKGICSISLGGHAESLRRAVRERFHAAEIVEGDRAFARLVARVIDAVEHPARELDLPLDVRGTAFQHRVWRALRRIKAGETRSYAEIARSLGAPTASRAVAAACGANPIAVAIPCHRVIRADASLAGYRWGVERKAELLERERRGAAARR